MTARALLLAASITLLAISLLGMFTDQEKEPQMRAGSTTKPIIYTNKEP